MAVDASEALDQLLHERKRLGIVSALAANASLTFGELKDILSMSDGNLSVHARKLEDAKYIKVTKGYAGRKPRTEYELTPRGRTALQTYLDKMEAILSEAREALDQTG